MTDETLWNSVLTNVWWTVGISGFIFLLFFYFQLRYFIETKYHLNIYRNFFTKVSEYKTEEVLVEDASMPQLSKVGSNGFDLNKLISEINHYVIKTRGTTDFSVIQNKVERNIMMRYEQAMAKLSFPTNIGLMGTFLGVFLGIMMFVLGFNGSDALRDSSIRNLLIGVLISMSTSFIGLLLTTINTSTIGESQKIVESDKNEFYDFVQTELMPSLDVSLVVAISKLHETVNNFEPAFNSVISNFQSTFDRCTRAFGSSFETNVRTVANAVDVMGANMDKINENIALQKSVLSTFKSDEVVRGLEKYVEAADHFVGITQSLNKFEEARRMMLAAAQEAIEIQNAYSESLKIPREIAVRINNILDRIKTFEDSINRIGGQLNEREILGNDVVNKIKDQINSIANRSKIADSYLEVADGNLEDLFTEQTEVIRKLNQRYTEAIQSHIDSFEKMMEDLKIEIEERRRIFILTMEENLNIDYIHRDFSNLSTLGDIYDEMMGIAEDLSRSNNLLSSIDKKQDLKEIAAESHEKKGGSNLFGGNENSGEIKRLQNENINLKQQISDIQLEDSHLKKQIDDLQRQIIKLMDIQNRHATYIPPTSARLYIPQTTTHPNNLSENQAANPQEKVKSDSPQPNEKTDVISENEQEKPEINNEEEFNEEKENVDEPKKKGIFGFFKIFKKNNN